MTLKSRVYTFLFRVWHLILFVFGSNFPMLLRTCCSCHWSLLLARLFWCCDPGCVLSRWFSSFYGGWLRRDESFLSRLCAVDILWDVVGRWLAGWSIGVLVVSSFFGIGFVGSYSWPFRFLFPGFKEVRRYFLRAESSHFHLGSVWSNLTLLLYLFAAVV